MVTVGITTDGAWRVDAEAITCQLHPYVGGTLPAAYKRGGWAVRRPALRPAQVRADLVGPGHVICEYASSLLEGESNPGRWVNEKASRGWRGIRQPATETVAEFAARELGGRALAAGTLLASTLKFKVPIAAFHHYGQADTGIYFGYPHGSSVRSSGGQILIVRLGSWHSLCQRHSTEPVAGMAAVLRDLMGHLWVAVGGSDLNGPQMVWDRDKLDFMSFVTDDCPHDSVIDVVNIAQTAGLVRLKRDSSGGYQAGLTPAGWVWYAANQRLAGDELIGDAMPRDDYTIKAGDSSVIQVGSHGSSAQVSRDHYIAETVGAQGPGSQGTATFSWLPSGSSIQDLQGQLGELRTVLRERARESQDDISIGAVGEAELAAADGDERRLLTALKKAGNWALTAAREVGLQVAVVALAKALGA
jgi:hypothetical protein